MTLQTTFSTYIQKYFIFFLLLLTTLKLFNLSIRKSGMKYFSPYELLLVSNAIITVLILFSSYWMIDWKSFINRIFKHTTRLTIASHSFTIKSVYIMSMLGLLTFLNIIIYYEFIKIHNVNMLIPLISVLYIIGTQLTGYFVFGEKLKTRQVLAIALLCVGILLLKI